MTTAADELRAAAARLRELATAASTDPHTNRPTETWEFRPKPVEFPTSFPPHGMLATPETDGRITNLIHGGGGGTRARSPWMFEVHGAYIATMGPPVGVALADWLDEEADRRDACLVAAIQIWGNAEHPDAVAWLTTGLGKGSAHALTLARLINTGSQA